MKLFYLVTGWLLLSTVSGWCTPGVADSVIINDGINDLKQLFQSEQFVPCIRACDHWLNKNGQNTTSIQRAEVWTIKANALRHQQHFKQALTLHQKALNIRKKHGGNSILVGNTYINIANLYLDQGSLDKADQFLNYAEKINPPEAITDTLSATLLANSRARFFHKKANHSLASKYFKKAHFLSQTLLDKNKQLVINQLIALANHFSSQMVPDSALYYLNRSLEILDKEGSNHPFLRAKIFNNLGNNWNQKGFFRQAFKNYEKAFLIYNQFALASQQKINCLINMGTASLEWGNNVRAIELFNESLHLSDTIPSSKIQVLNLLGQAHLYQGQQEEALRYLLEGVMVFREYPSLPKEQEGLTYFNLGSIYTELEQYSGAIYYLNKAMESFQMGTNATDRWVSCALKKVQCQIGQRKMELAQKELKVIESKIAPNTPLLNFSHWLLKGQTYLNQPDQAIQCFEKAIENLNKGNLLEETAFPYETIQAMLSIAQILFRQGKQNESPAALKSALEHCTNGVSILESWRAQFPSSQTIIQINNTFYQLYNLSIAICFELNRYSSTQSYAENALQHTEKYRTTFLENLIATPIPDDSIQIKLDSLHKTISYLKKQRFLKTQMNPWNNSSISIYSIDSALNATKIGLNHFHFQNNSNKTFSIQNLSGSVVQEKLAPNETLINYHWGDQQLFVFLLTRDTFLFTAIPNNQELAAQIEEFSFICRTHPDWLPHHDQASIFESYSELGYNIYQKILAPFEPFLRDQISIIPDGWLCLLPFDALIKSPQAQGYRFKKHDYLIKHFSIQYYQSLSHRALLQPNDSTDNHPIYAVAPEFRDNTYQLSTLFYNIAEVKSILKFWPGKSLEGNAAKKAIFLKEAEQQKILLLSTHGVMNDRSPEFSFLAFTEVKDQSMENDLLFATEISNLKLKADLVVLSACQTASGQLSRGEGLLSIAQSFFQAGAKSMVASLWNAGDQQAMQLISDFFLNLKEQNDKASAIRKAKLQYLEFAEDQMAAHPYYWAGFISIGNNEAVIPPSRTNYWYLLLVPVIIGAFRWFPFKNRLISFNSRRNQR